MTEKEKAESLVDRYEHHSKSMDYGINFGGDIDHAVECALICVNEVLEVESNYYPNEIDYWTEVKQEIIKS
jgi:hypothetical protein